MKQWVQILKFPLAENKPIFQNMVWMNYEQWTTYSFIKLTDFILQILKVCNTNSSISYVGRGLKRLYLIQVKTTKSINRSINKLVNKWANNNSNNNNNNNNNKRAAITQTIMTWYRSWWWWIKYSVLIKNSLL